MHPESVRSITARLPAISIRHYEAFPSRHILRLAAEVVPGEIVWARAGGARVEELAQAVGVDGGAAVGVGDTGDAAVVRVGAAVAVEVEGPGGVGVVVDAVAVKGRDLVYGGVAGGVVGCLWGCVAYGEGGAGGGQVLVLVENIVVNKWGK